MNLFFRVRVWWKRQTSRLWLRDSFCKVCGVDVRDFHAPDGIWDQVFRLGGMNQTLCYNCFCDKCLHIGLPGTWHLVEKKYCEYCGELWDIDVLKYASPMNLACPNCYQNAVDEDMHSRMQTARGVNHLAYDLTSESGSQKTPRTWADVSPMGELKTGNDE